MPAWRNSVIDIGSGVRQQASQLFGFAGGHCFVAFAASNQHRDSTQIGQRLRFYDALGTQQNRARQEAWEQ